MKKHKFLLFLSVVVFIIVLTITKDNGPLRFSVEPGFYNENLYLEIYGRMGHSIYYTLDGTTPTQNSTLYTEPIFLEDATKKENIYSNITTTSTGFYTDLIEQYSKDDPGYVVPNYNVDKCNIVRAAMYDKDGNFVSEISGSYFVGFNSKETYDNIRIVSLITDPKNLFDDQTGIYTTGNEFKNFRPSLGSGKDWYEGYWWMWLANYSLRGRESEREASIEVFDNGSTLLSENCGIRIQGGGSRGLLPKSLNIFSRPEYSGSGEFDADLFGTGYKPHKFTLFSGADDNIFKLKDYLGQSLESELNICTLDFIPCVLFLDGEFWGTYYMTESFTDDYIAHHYNIPKENVAIVKNKEITEGNETDMDWYNSVHGFIRDTDMTIDENYQRLQQFIDLESFIDYFASQIYLARCGDWPKENIAAWCSRGITQNSTYEDHKWRWMIFDLNSTGVELDYLEHDTIASSLEDNVTFASLCKNKNFKREFSKRLIYMGEEVFTEERCNMFLDQYLEDMLLPLCESNRRFYGTDKREDIIQNIENMKLFFKDRSIYVKESIVNNFGKEYLP